MPYALYAPALTDMRFCLKTMGRLFEVLALPGYAALSAELVDPILEEAARFATDVLSPLNEPGDRQGATLKQDQVTMPQGFKDAYSQFIANGWNAAPVPANIGGQGLPVILSTLIGEMWHGSNMSFGLCPMLTQSAIELLSHHGNDSLKNTYLPKLVSGEWAGTMCMTEPQAGSDVGAVRTRAEPSGDHYKITGTKIFITYGEQDFTDNIIHMVLARLPNAPAGTKGLSLFLAPKFLPDGTRNHLKCVSLEHKLGINASPTCVMAFEGATGYLIGEANRGMATMFSMMNPARFAVGLEGVGIAGYASQLAHQYASERIQTRDTLIAKHPDVERMLLTIRSHSEALRALAVTVAYHMDLARHHIDATTRAKAEARIGLLIPIMKSHGTDIAFTLCSTAIQIFGGMGYIKETGIEQLLRDIRVASIYEGTNGIQALDLALRKLPSDNNETARSLMSEIWTLAVESQNHSHPAIKDSAKKLESALTHLDKATIWMQQTTNDSRDHPEKLRDVQAAASSYLSLFGTIMESYLLLQSARAAHDMKNSEFPPDFLEQKITTAHFFALNQLPLAQAYAEQVMNS